MIKYIYCLKDIIISAIVHGREPYIECLFLIDSYRYLILYLHYLQCIYIYVCTSTDSHNSRALHNLWNLIKMPHSKCFSSGGLLSKSLAFKLSTMRDCRIERLHDRESGKGNYASSWHCQAGGNWHWKCQFWCVFEPNTIQTERKLQRHFTMLSRDVCVCVWFCLFTPKWAQLAASKRRTVE